MRTFHLAGTVVLFLVLCTCDGGGTGPSDDVDPLGIGFGEGQFSLIPAGTFQMGDITGSGRPDELPVHTVNITQPFYMQKTEVTQAQWQEVMGSNPSAFILCGDTCPVERVTWNEIQTFLATLNARDPGKNYRLPTEAEWEYACRAGTTGEYGGTGVLAEMGWYRENSEITTYPVAQKLANHWGLFDMHGNLREWVRDRYGAYPSGTVTDPTGQSWGTTRVLRGGSMDDSAEGARSARRFRESRPNLGGSASYGFRLARTPGEE